MRNLFIISGPAGSGKDAIIENLAELLPIERVITTTTRAPREGETNGFPYYFVSREVFETGIADGIFIEHSTNENAQLYGVTRQELERVTAGNHIGIWRIDWKGVLAAKALFPDILAIFISAPLTVLEERLRKRDGGEKDESYFLERMAYTREWLKHTEIYDYTVENEQGRLEDAVKKTAAFIQAHAA